MGGLTDRQGGQRYSVTSQVNLVTRSVVVPGERNRRGKRSGNRVVDGSRDIFCAGDGRGTIALDRSAQGVGVATWPRCRIGVGTVGSRQHGDHVTVLEKGEILIGVVIGPCQLDISRYGQTTEIARWCWHDQGAAGRRTGLLAVTVSKHIDHAVLVRRRSDSRIGIACACRIEFVDQGSIAIDTDARGGFGVHPGKDRVDPAGDRASQIRWRVGYGDHAG